MTQPFESWADSMGLDELDSDFVWAKQAWQAAQAAQPAQMPEGWKLVPVEPTQAMCSMGRKEWRDWSMHSDGSPWNMNGYKAIYKAMLAAAPSTKEGN